MKTKIAYIGKFRRLWDEEYIAQAFENIGCEVLRVPDNTKFTTIISEVLAFKPHFILFAKFDIANPELVFSEFRKNRIPMVCWIWDLYFGYIRENQITSKIMFKADIVITTDGGHDENWREHGINHHCVRQGIHAKECYKETNAKEFDIVFVGSDNPSNGRHSIIQNLQKDFPTQFHWFGEKDTNEVRGPKLNELYSKTKIVVGDSVYSPHYWSNRVVETLGRGGFLIHQETPGLREAYPYLVTYEKGDYEDLKDKINYYLSHDKERNDIINKNLKWVKDNYTCEKQCQKVLDICLKQ